MRACCEIGALAKRPPDGGVDVRRGTDGRHAIGRLEPHRPVVGALRIDDERAQLILGLQRGRARDDQVLLPLRDFRPRGDEIERRRLADVDARAVVALELEREVERALLHVDERERRDEQPSSARSASALVLTEALAEADAGDAHGCAG